MSSVLRFLGQRTVPGKIDRAAPKPAVASSGGRLARFCPGLGLPAQRRHRMPPPYFLPDSVVFIFQLAVVIPTNARQLSDAQLLPMIVPCPVPASLGAGLGGRVWLHIPFAALAKADLAQMDHQPGVDDFNLVVPVDFQSKARGDHF